MRGRLVRSKWKRGNMGVMVAAQIPIAQVQVRFKDLENGFRAWLAKQSLPVEAVVLTSANAAQGATIGAFMGTLTKDANSAIPTPSPQALAGGPLVQARNFAIMTGVNAGYHV